MCLLPANCATVQPRPSAIGNQLRDMLYHTHLINIVFVSQQEHPWVGVFKAGPMTSGVAAAPPPLRPAAMASSS